MINAVSFLLGLTIGVYVGLCVFFYFYNSIFHLNTSISIWEIISGLSAVLSAIGLVWVGLLTYRNQKNNAFQMEFDGLLREHSLMLKEIFFDGNKFNFYTYYLLYMASSDKVDFKCISERYIYRSEEISRYFILLYRILDRISYEVSNYDTQKRYSGILRVSIPHEILLLVAINSLNENYKKYKILLEKFNFLEHLPISHRFIRNIKYKSARYLNDIKNNQTNEYFFSDYELGDEKGDFDFETIMNVLNISDSRSFYQEYLNRLVNESFDRAIWGDNIYIKDILIN